MLDVMGLAAIGVSAALCLAAFAALWLLPASAE
jgi:hypothetical protein